MTLPSLAFIALLSVFEHFLPGWSRPDVFFSVVVDPAFRRTNAARSILRWYRAILWGFTLLAVALFLAAGLADAVIVQVGGLYCALAVAHRKALAHAASSNGILEVNLAAPPETLPGGALIAAMPLASLAVWVSRHWERLPARIPAHWGLNGADLWVPRTTAGIYGYVAMQAAISLIFLLAAWGILHWSRRDSKPGGQGAADRRIRRLNVEMVLLMSYVAAVEAWIVLLKPDAMGWWWGVALLIIIATYCIRLIRSGRRAIRTPVGDRTPDACWKLGSFYVNPDDPSVFVPKRFGIGYTVNFGNRWSWVVAGALLMAIFTKVMLKR